MLTVAATSGNLFNIFSRRAEQDAQCIPDILRSMWFADLIMFDEVF
jgi:hypothetical protein